MEIIKVTDSKYLSFIVNSQIQMASETEDFSLCKKTVTQGVKEVLQDSQKGQYYICLVDKEPAACLLTLPEWSDWRCRTVLWIHSVYVLPEFRKQGIYKAMYEHLKSFVSENDDYAGLRLYVDKTNTSAIEVYHKLGMNSDHYTLCEWMKER